MSFLDRAREQMRAATEQARAAAGQLGPKPEGSPEEGIAAEGDAQVAASPGGWSVAKAGLMSMLQRVDPGILAEVVIKATAVQEAANRALATRQALYRIDGISITATIPPQISFSIGRIDSADDPTA